VAARPLQPSPVTPLEAFARADEWERAAWVVAAFLVPGLAAWLAADGGGSLRIRAMPATGPAPKVARTSAARLVRPPRSC
jgi:hypothetical protein